MLVIDFASNHENGSDIQLAFWGVIRSLESGKVKSIDEGVWRKNDIADTTLVPRDNLQWKEQLHEILLGLC